MLAKVSAHGRLKFHVSFSILRCMREKLGCLQEQDSKVCAYEMEEDGPADDGRKTVEKLWKTMTWAIYTGEVPCMRALRSTVGWRTTSWLRSRSVWSMKKRSSERDRMEAQIWIPQQECSGIPRCRSGREKGRIGYSL